MAISKRQQEEVLEIVADILEPLGAECSLRIGKTHHSLQIKYEGQQHRIVFAKSPRTGFDNLKDWVRQDARKLKRKLESEGCHG